MRILRSALRGVIAVVSAAGLSAAFAATAAAQQGGAVHGTITDSVGHAPIAGVQVVVTGSARGSITNEQQDC